MIVMFAMRHTPLLNPLPQGERKRGVSLRANEVVSRSSERSEEVAISSLDYTYRSFSEVSN